MSDMLDDASDSLHSSVQELMNNGLLGGERSGMLQSWYFIATYIDEDGDEGIAILTDNESRASRALGLVRFGLEALLEEVRDWSHRADDG